MRENRRPAFFKRGSPASPYFPSLRSFTSSPISSLARADDSSVMITSLSGGIVIFEAVPVDLWFAGSKFLIDSTSSSHNSILAGYLAPGAKTSSIPLLQKNLPVPLQMKLMCNR